MPNIMSVVNRKPPTTLYHYTDFNGLIGIVSTGQIWMGDVFFLNDKKEYLEGLDIFNLELAKRKEGYKNDGISVFLNTLGTVEEALKKQTQFVFSLTEDNDLLSQWRGYTNNGMGVSIGFSSSEFLNSFKLLPCIYDRTEQELYVSHLFDLALNIFRNTPEKNKWDKSNCMNDLELPYWDAINEAGSKLISTLDVACAIIKNPAFKEEKEWRLISFDDDGLHFVSKASFVKPIKKTSFSNNKGIINSIKVGPTPDRDLCVRSIKKLLDCHFTHSVDISMSSIPYRN